MDNILVPVSPGELIDKMTILRIKSERITDPAKLLNVRHELEVLGAVARDLPPTPIQSEELYQINLTLWQIEDDIRACEARQDFGPEFIRLARAVYQTNDRRAEVKKLINLLLGSQIVEEKSYYGSP